MNVGDYSEHHHKPRTLGGIACPAFQADGCGCPQGRPRPGNTVLVATWRHSCVHNVLNDDDTVVVALGLVCPAAFVGIIGVSYLGV